MRLLLALVMSGCSLQWKVMRADTQADVQAQQLACAKLDKQQIGANVASLVLGGLSGASGLTSVVVSDNPRVVEAMGGVALAVTIGSGVSAYLAAIYTQRYCRQCANLVPPVTP